MSNSFTEMTDQELITQFQVQETREKAYSVLVKRYQEPLYWHIRRMVVSHDDSNDILQNVFIKVWRFLENFRNESSLSTWLYQIANNETYTFIEKEKKKMSISMSGNEDIFANKLKSEKGFDANQAEWKLQMAIQSLPEKQKAVFCLRYYDEMPYEKMAEILGSSVGSLKSQYHTAAKKIQEFFKAD